MHCGLSLFVLYIERVRNPTDFGFLNIQRQNVAIFNIMLCEVLGVLR